MSVVSAASLDSGQPQAIDTTQEGSKKLLFVSHLRQQKLCVELVDGLDVGKHLRDRVLGEEMLGTVLLVYPKVEDLKQRREKRGVNQRDVVAATKTLLLLQQQHIKEERGIRCMAS